MNRRHLLLAAAACPFATQAANAMQRISDAEIAQFIGSEGGLTIFDPETLFASQLAEQFQLFIKATYAVDIAVTFDQTSQVSELLQQIEAGAVERTSPPVDLMTTSADDWMSLRMTGQPQDAALVSEFVSTGLVPNYDRTFTALRLGESIAPVQSSNAPAIIYDSARIDWLTDWTDLADTRLTGRILFPEPDGQLTDGLILGMSSALKFDYRNPDQMDVTLDYLTEVMRAGNGFYSSDPIDAESALLQGQVDVVIQWTAFARRLSRSTLPTARSLLARKGLYPFNDQLWMPIGAAHPILAQLYIDWRMSDAVQFPDLAEWGMTEADWLTFHQGLLGKSYEAAIPEWIAADYFDLYPTADQFYKQIKELDWEYYVSNRQSWRDAIAASVLP